MLLVAKTLRLTMILGITSLLIASATLPIQGTIETVLQTVVFVAQNALCGDQS